MIFSNRIAMSQSSLQSRLCRAYIVTPPSLDEKVSFGVELEPTDWPNSDLNERKGRTSGEIKVEFQPFLYFWLMLLSYFEAAKVHPVPRGRTTKI